MIQDRLTCQQQLLFDDALLLSRVLLMIMMLCSQLCSCCTCTAATRRVLTYAGELPAVVTAPSKGLRGRSCRLAVKGISLVLLVLVWAADIQPVAGCSNSTLHTHTHTPRSCLPARASRCILPFFNSGWVQAV
jgi:hypothetical protein